jgi:hypothetical protein
MRPGVYRVRCGCGLYQTAALWRAGATWWLRCLHCGPTPYRADDRMPRTPEHNRRLTRQNAYTATIAPAEAA